VARYARFHIMYRKMTHHEIAVQSHSQKLESLAHEIKVLKAKRRIAMRRAIEDGMSLRETGRAADVSAAVLSRGGYTRLKETHDR
jgi:hypothetical protein